MTCPYCGKEMRKGTILGYRQPVDWFDSDNLHDISWDSWQKKRVRLSESDSCGNTMTEAYHCADCKMVIIPQKM